MPRLINGRTPDQHAAWNRWHLTVATLLALALLLLSATGRGPGLASGPDSCCGVEAPTGAVEPVVPAVPVDLDGDGVIDAEDDCPNTPDGMTVNARGCEFLIQSPGTDAAATPVASVDLYFELDRSDLPAGAADALAHVVEYLLSHPSAVALVSGYHDPTGDREHNVELAKNRALSVRDHLAQAGVEEARIDLRKPVETTGSGTLEEARRVEVSVRP